MLPNFRREQQVFFSQNKHRRGSQEVHADDRAARLDMTDAVGKRQGDGGVHSACSRPLIARRSDAGNLEGWGDLVVRDARFAGSSP